MADIWAASESTYLPALTLTPPMSSSFRIYGGDDVQSRVRAWASARRYWRVGGVPDCPHGMYGMVLCPADCYGQGALDHVSMWFRSASPDDGRPELFLMSHPYSDGVPDDTRLLARAHGLAVYTLRSDDWYAPGRSTGIRLAAESPDVVWPIEPRLLVLSQLCPAPWEERAAADEDAA